MLTKAALTIIFSFLLIPQAILGQDTSATADRARVLSSARKLMEKARYCSLITIGDDGQPQARVVDPFAPDETMIVWIATNPASRKIAQIKKDARVTLYYLNPNNSGYVTILGKADLVDVMAEKEKHWKEAWSFLYKDKYRGEDFTLIRVRPRRLEIVSYPDKLINDPKTWRPVQIVFPE
jgi:general stress protein 26